MENNKIDIKDIKPYEKNAKIHPDSQLEKLAVSLRDFGWKQPIVVDKNNVIIIGHGRFFAYKKYLIEYGIKEPWIIKADDLTPEKVKELRLVDNKLNESDWNYKLLQDNFTFDFLLGVGFGKDELLSNFGLNDIDNLQVDQERLNVIMVEMPEAVKLKERISFYCDSKEEFDLIKEFFGNSIKLDRNKLIDLIKEKI